MNVRQQPTAGHAAAAALWCVVGMLLAAALVQYGRYAVAVLRYPFGLDSSEGLLWQQALWMPGPHMYGSIAAYPFMVFEYPPIYLACVRLAGWLGLNMLAAGRAISIAGGFATAGLMGFTLWRICRPALGRTAAWVGCGLACLLPFTLLPILSWAVLMRVDVLALAWTWCGVALAIAAVRRPGCLPWAMLAFVAALFTKQNYVSAPLAVALIWGVRSPRIALRAGLMAALCGIAAAGALTLATQGGFLRHIIVYMADWVDPARALRATLGWLAAYPIFGAGAAAAIVVIGRMILRDHPSRRPAAILAAIRQDDRAAFYLLLLTYTALSTCTLISAGKTGASRNYFLEWMCLWCVWVGWLSAVCVHATQTGRAEGAGLRLLVPALLLLQLCPVPGAIDALWQEQLSARHRDDAARLLARARTLKNGPFISDDMVMTIRSGREVGLETGILLEMERTGLFDEGKLIALIDRHFFAAVVTAYDPGNPDFDARYLPATRQAILRDYPNVEAYGPYRMRLPPPAR